MRTAAVFVACSLGAALLAGCGSEKRLPDAVIVPQDDPKEAGPQVPKASEEEAKKIVDRCLKAASGGDSAKLAKLRTVRIIQSGSMQLGGNEQAGPGAVLRYETARTVEVVWPDRARQDDVFQKKEMPHLSAGIRWPEVWFAQERDGESKWFHPSQADERLSRAEFVANVWLPLLVPLTDPNTIVVDARKITVGKDTVDVIQAYIRDCPPFTLWFDPATGTLTRASFAVTDGSHTIHGFIVAGDYKSFDGLQLPSRIGYVKGDVQVAEWKWEKIEFLDKIDPARFDPPREEKK